MRYRNTADDFWNAAVKMHADLPYAVCEAWMRERIWLYLFMSYAYDDIV